MVLPIWSVFISFQVFYLKFNDRCGKWYMIDDRCVLPKNDDVVKYDRCSMRWSIFRSTWLISYGFIIFEELDLICSMFSKGSRIQEGQRSCQTCQSSKCKGIFNWPFAVSGMSWAIASQKRISQMSFGIHVSGFKHHGIFDMCEILEAGWVQSGIIWDEFKQSLGRDNCNAKGII